MKTRRYFAVFLIVLLLTAMSAVPAFAAVDIFTDTVYELEAEGHEDASMIFSVESGPIDGVPRPGGTDGGNVYGGTAVTEIPVQATFNILPMLIWSVIIPGIILAIVLPITLRKKRNPQTRNATLEEENKALQRELAEAKMEMENKALRRELAEMKKELDMSERP